MALAACADRDTLPLSLLENNYENTTHLRYSSLDELRAHNALSKQSEDR